MSNMSSTKRAKAKGPKKKAAPPRCPKCAHKHTIKSGMVQGEQRWKCKQCAYQYTRIAPRGRPIWQKSLAVFLYSYGVSMHSIGKIFHIQPSTVLKWVRSYAKDFRASHETGDIAFMELSDMRPFLKDAANQHSGMLLIAIDDETFKKSLGITISQR
jgi:transposase-like protein